MSQTYYQLKDHQRHQIEAYLKSGKRKNFIAEALDVSGSTIYRECKRNSSPTGIYHGSKAHLSSTKRKQRYCNPRSFDTHKRKLIKEYLLQEQWSPKQLVGYGKIKQIPMVSHERIYQYIRDDKAAGGQYYKHLRHQLKHRKRPVGKPVTSKNRVSIDQRPECINNKERFGDWEVDTIIGRQQKGAMLTIVERTTGMLIIKKLPKGKQAKGLSKELINRMMPYKKHILSISSDNGTEFADHQNIAKNLATKFYFAHPYCSWQRGLNEYTNKLIRQYILKKTAFDTLNDEQITQIQHKINRRPREKLNFKTPKEIFYLNTA